MLQISVLNILLIFWGIVSGDSATLERVKAATLNPHVAIPRDAHGVCGNSHWTPRHACGPAERKAVALPWTFINLLAVTKFKEFHRYTIHPGGALIGLIKNSNTSFNLSIN